MNRFFFIILLNSVLSAQINNFIKGVDISMLKQVEESGGHFYENGTQIDPIQVFKSKGVNTVRLKIWHNPSLGYNGLESVLEIAERVKNEELDLLLDFHFSDTWADPSHQNKPSAWENLNFETLCDSIKQYSAYVIRKLKNQNTLPKYVQIGNETDCGILWPDGYVCDESNNDIQWEKLSDLFKHAIDGVKSVLDSEDTLGIISHVSSGGNWFFNNLIEQGVNVDILGISYYPMWHGTLVDLNQNIDVLFNQFQKPVIVLETAYPFTLLWNDTVNNILGLENQLIDDYEASEEGQYSFLSDLIALVDDNEFGYGVCYWSPEWISTDQFGSPWENQALFDFDGQLLSAISAFENSNVSTHRANKYIPRLTFNYPNPFNSNTQINYDLQKSGIVSIDIYNIKGIYIKSLFNNFQSSGYYTLTWNGTNSIGKSVSAGMYLYIIKAGDFRITKKMVLLK